MTPVFADTFYWYALANRRDQWHSRALEAKSRLNDRPILTTEDVLVEFLAAMSRDPFLRKAGVPLVQALFADPASIVLP